jgi:hypothetical protein
MGISMDMRGSNLSVDGQLDVLASIPEEYRASVVKQCERRAWRRGETIWSQEEPAASS